jgi:hypothetical protein
MIKEALEYLMDLGDEPITREGDRRWIKGGFTEIMPPMPDPVRFYSLTSFVEFIKMAEERDEAFVQVVSPTQVEFIGMLDDRRKRASYATANPLIDGAFQKATWMTQEVFVTDVQAYFAENKDRAKLLKIVGNVRSEESVTLEDDGVTQKVATAAGVVAKQMEVMPNPVILQPYETFPEIEQPDREYIVRFRGGEMNEHVTFALFPVPDPRASFNTCVLISDWLVKNLSSTEVVLG